MKSPTHRFRLIPIEKNWTGQFLVGLKDAPRLEGADLYQLNGVVLQVFPGLRVIPVQDQAGDRLGWLLGDVIDCDAQELIVEQRMISLNDGIELDATIEREIYRFSGRFIFVLASTHSKRIYLDACGSLSLVYDPVSRVAASSTGLLLNDDSYVDRFDKTLYDFLDIAAEGWFPAGLTAHTGISRLVCNHYLDLAIWQSVRHWPTEKIGQTLDPQSNVAKICSIVRSTLTTLRQTGSTVVALTAGNETRLLLACCKEFIEDINFVTVDAPENRLDVIRARELVEKFQLRHTLLPLIRASEEQALQFQYQAGHCRGGGNAWGHPSINPLAEYQFFIGGLGGEIGRAFFWRDSDDDLGKVTPSNITYRMGMPVHPKVLEAVEYWFDSIKHMNPLLQIDLAYLELRMSCWGFAQAYSHPVVPHIHPLISRETFRLMLELPSDWKRKGALITKGIEAQWPALLSLPINRYGDVRDVLFKLTKAVKNPRLVAKKIRKRFGGNFRA